MVSFNRPELVFTCLDSLYANTKYPFELYLVDNGSKPEMQNTLYKRTAPNMHLFLQEENLGIAAARNLGLTELKDNRGEWPEFIGLFDSDIIFRESWLTRGLELISNIPELGIFGCCFGSHSSKGEFYFKDIVCRRKKNQPGHSWILRSAVLDAIGLFDPKYGFQPSGKRMGFSDGNFVGRMLDRTKYKVASTAKESDLVEHKGISDA